MQDEDEVVRVKPTEKRGGDWVRIGDEEYRIPALGFFDLQELSEDIKALGAMDGMPSSAQFDSIGRIVITAIQRNYPGLEDVAIRKMLDLSNFKPVLEAVLKGSGLVKKAGVKGEATGEAPASTGG